MENKIFSIYDYQIVFSNDLINMKALKLTPTYVQKKTPYSMHSQVLINLCTLRIIIVSLFLRKTITGIFNRSILNFF